MALQISRNTSANFIAGNDVLEVGEIGYEIDTGNVKVGDGSTTWTNLEYDSSTDNLTVSDKLIIYGELYIGDLTTIERNALTPDRDGLIVYDTDLDQLFVYKNSGWFSNADPVVLTVGSYGDFTTIKDAIDSISDNSSSKPYTIQVNPGVYPENNPIVGKSYVSIIAVGGKGSVEIDASNAGNLFVGIQNFLLRDLTFSNVVTGYAVEMLSTGDTELDNCIISNCEDGFHVNHATGAITANHTTIMGSNSGTMFEVTLGSMIATVTEVAIGAVVGTVFKTTGGRLDIHGLLSIGTGVTTGIDIADSTAVIRDVDILTATDGIVIDGVTSNINFFNINITDCLNDGLVVGTGEIHITGLVIHNSARYNINITGAAKMLGYIDTDLNKAYINPSSTTLGIAITDVEDDEGVLVHGHFSVGNPVVPGETVLGGGDSYTNGMMVYDFDGTTYTDISASAKTASGSTFSFPNTNVNTAFYLTSIFNNGDYLTHPGIKVKVDTAIVLGGGELVYEYWDGASWVEFNFMVTDSGGRYFPYAKALFESAGSYQVRYDIAMTDLWVKNDPVTSGVDRYWARIRIATAITTSPILEQFKLHTNRTEINEDGYIEMFGTGRTYSRFPFDAGLLEAAASSPGNSDLYISDFIDVGRVENRFQNGVIDRLAFLSPVPSTLDTSSDISFSWSILTDDTTSGDIEWIVRWASSGPTDNVYRSQGAAPATAPNEQSITLIAPAPTINNTTQWYTVSLDVSDIISRRDGDYPDTFWMSLERDGGSDSHNGDVSLIAIASDFLTWCIGGHY